jgi:hypothetical protein
MQEKRVVKDGSKFPTFACKSERVALPERARTAKFEAGVDPK